MQKKKAVKVLTFFSLCFLILFSGFSKEDENKLRLGKECSKIMQAQGPIIASCHQLKLLDFCSGLIADSRIAYYGYHLTSSQPMTIDEARPLMAEIICYLLNVMYCDPHFENYFAMRKLPFNNNLVAIRLAFWDEHVNRPLYPYLAQVRLSDSNVYYHYADPKTQSLQEPIVEPLSALVSVNQ